jgi:hypothetical protein
MSINRFGRYADGSERHGSIYESDGKVYIALPERLPFQSRSDTISHVCKGGETCLSLAVQYYKNRIGNAIDMWWVIQQFQPSPIVNPCVPFVQNDVILIPSYDYIINVAYGESLDDYPQL